MTNKHSLRVIPFMKKDNSEEFHSKTIGHDLSKTEKIVQKTIVFLSERDKKNFPDFIISVREIIEKNNIDVFKEMRPSQTVLFEPKSAVKLENGTISGLSEDEILGDSDSLNLIVQKIRNLISSKFLRSSFYVDLDVNKENIIIASDKSAYSTSNKNKNPKIYHSNSDDGYKKGNPDGLDDNPGDMYKPLPPLKI